MTKQENHFNQYDSTTVSKAGNYLAGINEKFDKILRFIPDQVMRQGLIAAGVPLDPEGRPTIFGEAAQMIEARTPDEKAFRKAGNFTAEALPMVAGANVAAIKAPLKLADDIAKYAKNPSVINALKSTADEALRLIQTSPGKAGAVEGTLAATSGLGGGMASELSDGNPVAEQVGMLIGGSLPSATRFTTVGLASRGGRFLKNKLSTDALEEHAKGVVGRQLRGELTVEAQENIKQSSKAKTRMKEKGAEFNPTLAEQTGSPGLIQSQIDIESGLSGSELDQFVQRKRGDRIAIEKFTEAAAPESEPIPEFIVDTVTGSVNKDAGKISADKASLQKDKEALAGKFKTTDRFEQGSRIRDRLLKLRADKRAELNAEAENLGINDQDITDSFSTWASSVLQEMKPDSELFSDKDNIPEVLSSIRTAIKGEAGEAGEGMSVGFFNDLPTQGDGASKPKTVTFKDLKALRERVSDDLIDAMTGDSPSRAKVRALTILKERVDGLIDEIPETMVDPAMKEAYQSFRQRYFSDYIERFEKGAAFDVKRKDGRGFFMTEEEKIGDAFFEPGGISAARQYKSTFGEDPEAYEALKNIAVDRFRQSVVRDGIVDPEAYKSWMREHESVLREFPGIRKGFRDVGQTMEWLLSRQSQLKARETFLETRALTQAIRSYEKGGQAPEAILQGILKNDKRLEDFLGRVKGDERSYMGFKRWLWDQAVDDKNAEKFILQNEQLLNDVLGKQHLEDIKTVLTAREVYGRVPEPAGKAMEQDVFKQLQETTGVGVPQIISRVLAVQRGRSSKWVETGGSFANLWGARSTKQQKALMREALYDPEIARMLSDSLTTAKLPEAKKRQLNAWLFNAGMHPYTEDDSPPSDNHFNKYD